MDLPKEHARSALLVLLALSPYPQPVQPDRLYLAGPGKAALARETRCGTGTFALLGETPRDSGAARLGGGRSSARHARRPCPEDLQNVKGPNREAKCCRAAHLRSARTPYGA